jgi:hypothetical protein
VKLVKNNDPILRYTDLFRDCSRTFQKKTGIVFIIPIEIVLARPKRRAGRGFANLSRSGNKSHLDIIFKMIDQQCLSYTEPTV